MKLLILTLSLFTLSFSELAFAQGSQIFQPPGSEFKNEALEKLQRQQAQMNRDKGFIRPSRLYVSLVTHDYFEDDQFGMLFKLKDIVSGCFEYSPLEYEVNFVDGNYMEVAVRHYKRTKIETDNPNADCPTGNQAVSGLVVLSANDLKNKGIYEMRLTNGGAMDRYAVAYYDDRIEIIPLTMAAFEAEGLQGSKKDRLIHFNTQNDVLALHVPMADSKDDISDAVHDLAAQKGMAPIGKGEMERYPSQKNVFYFTDNGGTIVNQLNEEDFVELGTVEVMTSYEGTEGLNKIGKPLKVFATKPGNTL